MTESLLEYPIDSNTDTEAFVWRSDTDELFLFTKMHDLGLRLYAALEGTGV